jgi:hypothetical protein
MLIHQLSSVKKNCAILANNLQINGMSYQYNRINKFIDMLSFLESLSESVAKEKLSSKPYRAEFEYLYGEVTHIRGLKDSQPIGVSSFVWRQMLSDIQNSLEKLSDILAFKKKLIRKK